MSQTLTSPPAAPVVNRRRPLVADLLAGSAYVLTGFPLAVIAFALLVTGTALGLGTLVIVLGLAVLALTASHGAHAQPDGARPQPVQAPGAPGHERTARAAASADGLIRYKNANSVGLVV